MRYLNYVSIACGIFKLMLFKLTRDKLKFYKDSNLINLYFFFFSISKCFKMPLEMRSLSQFIQSASQKTDTKLII